MKNDIDVKDVKKMILDSKNDIKKDAKKIEQALNAKQHFKNMSN